jgi:energy-coupling factor transporter ATP-binding protein EcfA2
MSQVEQSKIQDIIDQFRQEITVTLEGIEQLSVLLFQEHSLDDTPGWRELKARPLIWRDSGESPWLVATLFGPTGAGKSTVFRLLTGLMVPAGNTVRPVTFNPLVAFPENSGAAEVAPELFPFHELSEISDLDLLKDKTVSREILFYTSYRQLNDETKLGLVLADVPDFDTIYQKNWEKAEDMLRRAEVVLFTIYPAAYMDHIVVSNLQKCCLHAGKLALLFNKVESREQAEIIWQDLIQKVSSAEEFATFQQNFRSNGSPLFEFLKQADVYFSLQSPNPSLAEIRPLTHSAPDFCSLLTGLDGARILLSSLKEDTRKGIATCLKLCDQAEDQIIALERQVTIAEKHLKNAASIVVGTVAPMGKISELILQSAQEYRPQWIKLVGVPLSFITELISKSTSSLKRYFQGSVKPIDELEQDRLSQILDELFTAWRADLPEANLSMETLQRARENFKSHNQAPPSSDWESVVKQSAKEWALKNPWKTKVLGSINDLLLSLGGAAAGVDLLLTGAQTTLWSGVVLGKLGLVGAAGAGSAVAGAFLRFFEKLGLRKTLEIADASWRKHRSEEISNHIRKNLAEPLFLAKWEQDLAKLKQTPLSDYRGSCDRLDTLIHGF